MIRTWWHKVKQELEGKALILMYHRVAEPACDPWQLAVSPRFFEEHLKHLRQRWRPVSLAELTTDLNTGSISRRSVILTFDDGYLDNFVHAKPLLEKYKIPATFFITTKNCIEQTPFWWDELQSILVETPILPRQLTLTIADEVVHFDLEQEAILTPALAQTHREWTVEQGTPTLRSQLYVELWRRLKPLVDQEQQIVMAALRQWADLSIIPVNAPLSMDLGQIKKLQSNRLFTIGAHTVTHPALAEHGASKQLEEIAGSRNYLEKLLVKPIDLFAYPYGNYNELSVTIVKEENFLGAVTTREGIIDRSSQPLQLGRYQVTNWKPDTFSKKLSQWYNRR